MPIPPHPQKVIAEELVDEFSAVMLRPATYSYHDSLEGVRVLKLLSPLRLRMLGLRLGVEDSEIREDQQQRPYEAISPVGPFDQIHHTYGCVCMAPLRPAFS